MKTNPLLRARLIGSVYGVVIGLLVAALPSVLAQPQSQFSTPTQLRLVPPKPTPHKPTAVITCGTLDGQGEVAIDIGDSTLVVKINCPAPKSDSVPNQKGNII